MRVRFSLRSLILLPILLGCVALFWQNYDPWTRTLSVTPVEPLTEACVCSHGKYFLTLGIDPKGNGGILRFFDSGTGNQISESALDYPSQFSSASAFGTDGGNWIAILGNKRNLFGGDKCEWLEIRRIPDGANLNLPENWVHAKHTFLAPGFLSFDSLNRTIFDIEHQKILPLNNQRVLALSCDGKFAATSDGLLLDTSNTVLPRQLMALAPGPRRTAVFSEDGSRLAISIASTTLVFETTTGRKIAEVNGDVRPSPRAFSSDNQRMLIWVGARVSVVSLQSGAATNLAALTRIPYNNLCFSPDGRMILSTEKAQTFNAPISMPGCLGQTSIFDSATGRLVFFGTVGCSSSPDGRWLLCGGGLIDAQTGIERTRINASKANTSFFDNDRILMCGGNSADIWTRRRPEYWWGIAWLWEFWAACAAMIAMTWSFWRDVRQV